MYKYEEMDCYIQSVLNESLLPPYGLSNSPCVLVFSVFLFYDIVTNISQDRQKN